jgi:hypothetical protein
MIKAFSDWLVSQVFRLDISSQLGGSLNFFIYDVIKIFLLLVLIIFLVAFIRSFLPPEKIKKIIKHRFGIVANILAACLGIVTPFCSCSAVPLFIGFIESGVPLGVTFSFLIASPMINEIALVMLWGLFGWKIALLYIFSGLVIAVLSGYIIGKLHLEKYVEEYVYKIQVKHDTAKVNLQLKTRTKDAINYVGEIIKQIWLYVLIGIGIGALIHGYVPANFLIRFAGPGNPFAVPIAVIIGVPLYANAAGVMPIVQSLIEKGLPIGTSLAFMMAVTGLSLPATIILRKVLKPRLLATFIIIVSIGIIITGYLFNWIL